MKDGVTREQTNGRNEKGMGEEGGKEIKIQTFVICFPLNFQRVLRK